MHDCRRNWRWLMTEDRETQRRTPARKGRPEWIDWLWALLPLAGGVLLVPWGVDWPYSLALVSLWLMGGVMLFTLSLVYAALAFAPQLAAWTPDDARWTARRGGSDLGHWVRWIAFNLGLVVAPLVADYPLLAGCFAILQIMIIGLPDLGGKDIERIPSKPRRVGKAVFWTIFTVCRLVGWGLSSLARVLFWPILRAAALIGALFRRWSQRRLARRLRSDLGVSAGAVYFVYSEQHQFDRYLGPGGILHSAISGVIARNWRNDIQGGLSVRSKTPLGEAELTLLRRYRISNMREDLPFAVVIAADDRLHDFHLSKPYRMRRRDGGTGLRDIENRLRLFIAVAD